MSAPQASLAGRFFYGRTDRRRSVTFTQEDNMIRAIIFDLDGTLLPLTQERFTQAYFARLGRRGAKLGFDPEAFIAGVWQGTKAMFRNDGSRSNEETFWQVFAQALGQDTTAVKAELDEFYAQEFGLLSQDLGPFPDRGPLVRRLGERGFRLALASNPVFPREAVAHRLAWLGLRLDDFALATDYSTCCFCKPAPGYYQEVCRGLGLPPQDCLMVGNSVVEDGLPLRGLGGNAFILTELLEGPAEGLKDFPHGDWAGLEQWLEALAEPGENPC